MFPTHFVFNHFPKAGGTSFFAVCKYNIPESEISPQLMEEEIRLVRPERFEHYRLIRGHFSVLTQMGFSRHRYSMTLVRDPIQTILSTYKFWRTRPEEDALTRHAKSMPFAEFVRHFARSPSIIHNPYTHHFAALSRDYPEEADDKELLAAAKHNLAAFDFVGICEQFGNSVRLLCQQAGWHVPPKIPHENRSREAQLQDLDDTTEQMLRERNRLDLELYDYAIGLFRARRDAIEEFSPGPIAPQTEPVSAIAKPARNRFVAFPVPKAVRRRASIQQVIAIQEQTARLTAVRVAYEVAEPIADLAVGVAIHNANGEIAYGPVVQVEKPPNLVGPRGERQVTFNVACDFAPQTYSVTAALESVARPGVRYDWMDRATIFCVPAPSKIEFWVKNLATRVAKLIFGPFSRPVWRRLQAHLQPVEEKLGLVERATAGLRDRVVELSDAVAEISEQQKTLLQRFGHPPRQTDLRVCEPRTEVIDQAGGAEDVAGS